MPEKPFSKVGKIVGINLAILLAFGLVMLIPSLGSSDQYAGMGYGIGMLMLVPAQILVNLVVGIVYFTKKNQEMGKAYMLAMLAVAVIGTSACFGGMALF